MQLDKTHIQRRFDQSAACYDRFAGMQREITDELLRRVTPGHGNAIDLGCGTGFGLQRLHQLQVPRVVGLDLALGMLKVAERTGPRAQWVVGDIESLPFADRQFDLVFSSSAIQWCDLRTALAEIQRIIKPGGQILLSSFVRGTLADWRRLWGLHEQAPFVDLMEFRQALDAIGLVDAELSTLRYTPRFISFDAAVASIRELGASHTLRDRPSGLMGKRRYALIKAQVEQTILRQGYIELSYHVVCVDARAAGGIRG